MQAGRRLAPSPALPEIRQRAYHALTELPSRYRQLRDAPPYPVHISSALQSLLSEVSSHVAPVSESHARK